MITQSGSTLFHVSFDSADERMEIQRWLKENITDKTYIQNEFWLLFGNEIDALSFKLRWT